MFDQFEIVEKHFQLQELPLGEHFVKEGQYAKVIGYVASGMLYSYQIDQRGEMVTTNFFQPGSFCGSFFSFYRQAPALESIRTI